MIDPHQKTMRVRRFVVNSLGTHADLVNQLHRMVSRFWPATAVDAVNLEDAVAQILARLREHEEG